jgi:hypothetical protein
VAGAGKAAVQAVQAAQGLLILALAVWIFFNYERIPGMFFSLWRAIVSGISSLLAKI